MDKAQEIRQAVLDDVAAERQRQLREFTCEDDDRASAGEWIASIKGRTDYLWARTHDAQRTGRIAALRNAYVQIAALCVAAAESLTRKGTTFPALTEEQLDIPPASALMHSIDHLLPFKDVFDDEVFTLDGVDYERVGGEGTRASRVSTSITGVAGDNLPYSPPRTIGAERIVSVRLRLYDIELPLYLAGPVEYAKSRRAVMRVATMLTEGDLGEEFNTYMTAVTDPVHAAAYDAYLDRHNELYDEMAGDLAFDPFIYQAVLAATQPAEVHNG